MHGITHDITLLMTCRAGSTLSSSQAYKLHSSTPPPHRQDAAVASQGSSGQAETSIVAHITVATAAYVPQVCDVVMLSRLRLLVCSVKEGCFLGLVAFPYSRCDRTGMTLLALCRDRHDFACLVQGLSCDCCLWVASVN